MNSFNLIGTVFVQLSYFALHFQKVVDAERPVRGDISDIIQFRPPLPTPRLPVWNGAPQDSGGQRQIDFTQLFEMMGEPRGSRGRALSELISRPRPKCNRRIRVLNGVTRLRERGSLARFQCSHGFTLIGPTTVVCLRDRWSEPPPFCVRNGCRPLRRPEHGEVRESIGGAVATFYCEENAKLIGDSLIYCNGNQWNGTEPTCHLEPTTTTAIPTTEGLIIPSGVIHEHSSSQVDDFVWDSNVQQQETTTEEEETTTDLADLTTSTTIEAIESWTTTESHPTAYLSTTLQSILHEDTTSTPIKLNEVTVKPVENSTFPTQLVHHNSTIGATENATVATTRRPVLTTPLTLKTTVLMKLTSRSQFDLFHNQTSTLPPPFRTNAIITTPKADDIPLPLPTQRTPVFTIRPSRGNRRTTRRPRRPIFNRRRVVITRPTTTRPKSPKRPRLNYGRAIRRFRPSVVVTTTTVTSTLANLPDNSRNSETESFSDYPVAIDTENFPPEQVEPIRHILPD